MGERLWIIVDDQLADAEAFAASFQRSLPVSGFTWRAIQAAEGQSLLLQGNADSIAGVLIDVDLSSDGKVVGTGLGLAQDVRARQKNKKLNFPDFPIFRFANPDPVREYIGDDPASDDLFDILIAKDFARNEPAVVVKQVGAVREVYDGFTSTVLAGVSDFEKQCGLQPGKFEVWGDNRLWQKIRLGLSDTSTTHVASGTFLRTFLVPEGLLISEELLAVRLGVDRSRSPGWTTVLDALQEAKYNGLGAGGFERWWSRGLDVFWLKFDQEEYLHQRTSAERVATLRGATGADLRPLEPPAKYWRLCALSRRRNELRPIDPERSVFIVQRVPQEPWVEPEQAALEVAAMLRDDPRVDPDELARAAT